ncbi:hypothetical protein P3X46_021151 [Hevea brasiliensis]|uniref:Uncharacterized protein n=1 Tax=Hevea brasiliensis TaxID=3981 RepID=A0ABQ9LGJ0_HEVBR|nr:uncharacterized protein LOC110669773 [Hevea brasiliensis]KAJ9166385.1 hypothetical protein P3X46_021151 [Hevea brasiliensis]
MASSLFTSSPKFQIILFKNQPGQLHRWQFLRAHSHRSPTPFMKITNSQFGKTNKVNLQFSIAKERLWVATPDPVKEFPWRKAGDVLLKRLLFIGQAALKWSLITIFIFSSVSDVIFSISRNQELMIPVGLLIGCLITDYLKEILQEMLQASEDKGLNILLVSISCFFVLVKVISAYFAARTQVFLLHVANGGLLQVLWLWRQLLKENDDRNKENFFTGDQDSSLAAGAKE